MFNIHKTHQVLGRYCWTCRIKTELGIPGWPKGHKGEFTRYDVWDINELTGIGATESIVWANGDSMRPKDQTQCSLCDKHCKYPVSRQVTEKGDNYREIKCAMLSDC